MKVQVVVTGIKKIDRGLKSLDIKIQKKIVRQGIRAGLKVMRAEVIRQVPVDTGLTKKSVKLKAWSKRRKGIIRMNVLISGGEPGLIKTSKQGNRTFYPAAVEYGVKGRKANAVVRFFAPKAKVYGDGSVKPNPFMRRAFQYAGKTSRDVAIRTILEGIEREAGKP